LLEKLLRRRVIFVSGKGGTGKTTVAAALALLAARGGKRVLAVDVDAKGDLAAALGSHTVGFKPQIVQPGISSLTLQAEESFQEYLNIYFKVPRLARLTPLARVFDFIATGVPGPRDMLVVGKIAYEERRRQANSRPVWDIIVVDAAPSGQVISHLTAARSLLTLVKGGMVTAQVQWVDELIRDHARTTVILCALPQEMPVVEAIELDALLRSEAGVAVDCCVLNRLFPMHVSPTQLRVARAMSDDAHANRVRERLGGPPQPLALASETAAELNQSDAARGRQLRSGLRVPVVDVPLVVARSGLAVSRIVAEAIAEATR
jgi:hypothetical protein